MTGTKDDYIEYRILKSKEIFEDARLLANNQRWNSCINRLYYSSFHLISALLYKHDIKSETHNGTKTKFNFYFKKPGLSMSAMVNFIPTFLIGDKKVIMLILLTLIWKLFYH